MKDAAAALGFHSPTHPLQLCVPCMFPSAILGKKSNLPTGTGGQARVSQNVVPLTIIFSWASLPCQAVCSSCALHQVAPPTPLGKPHSEHHWAQCGPPWPTSTCCSSNGCSSCTSKHHAGSEEALIRRVSMRAPGRLSSLTSMAALVRGHPPSSLEHSSLCFSWSLLWGSPK